MKGCQHYSYNSNLYDFSEGDAGHFAENFSPVEERINWLNFHSLSDRSSIEAVCHRFGVDSTTVIKIFSSKKEYGLEEYEGYMFFRLPAVDGNDITFIVTDSFVMTLQPKRYEIFSKVRERITKRIGKIRIKGIDFLVFRLLHCMIDHYSASMDSLEKEVIDLERYSGKDLLPKVEAMKRKLYEMKKKVSPVKSVVAQLEKIEDFVSMDDIRHFNELKHHAADIMDSIDECRQVLDGAVGIYYAAQGQRLNEVMKVLALISTIFIPITFVAGLYGMNFKYMPELNSPYGYPLALAAMAGCAIWLYRWFKGKGWLE